MCRIELVLFFNIYWQILILIAKLNAYYFYLLVLRLTFALYFSREGMET